MVLGWVWWFLAEFEVDVSFGFISSVVEVRRIYFSSQFWLPPIGGVTKTSFYSAIPREFILKSWLGFSFGTQIRNMHTIIIQLNTRGVKIPTQYHRYSLLFIRHIILRLLACLTRHVSILYRIQTHMSASTIFS